MGRKNNGLNYFSKRKENMEKSTGDRPVGRTQLQGGN